MESGSCQVSSAKRNIIVSTDGTKVYHLGIIDYLQKWNLRKKIERLVKSCVAKDRFYSLAAAPPRLYGNRFFQFIKKHVLNAEYKRDDFSKYLNDMKSQRLSNKKKPK